MTACHLYRRKLKTRLLERALTLTLGRFRHCNREDFRAAPKAESSAFFGIAVALVLSSLFLSPSLNACTAIKVTAQDGSTIHGRTAEFGIDIHLGIAFIPVGNAFEGTTPLGKGMAYRTKYAAIGSTTFNDPALIDGLNEKGLAVGAFYFPGYASYTPITTENQPKALSPLDFPNWILTSFATIDELKTALAGVVIAPTIIPGWGPNPPPMHYIVYDRSGKSLVIEPLNGKLITYDNPLGIITNSPSFDWHLTNLRNFIDLSPYNIKPVQIDDLKLSSLSQGSGLVGLPGDFTSPSRFVRATLYSASAIPAKTGDDAVLQVFHLLNQFDIPVGSVRQREGKSVSNEWTLATAVRDPQNLRYYVRTFADQTIRVVDLKRVDRKAGKIQRIDISQFRQPIEDITADLAQ